MEIYALKLVPLGSLRFRGPGEFSAGLRGPAITAVSLPYPLPSTVAGALAYIALGGHAPQGGCDPDVFECVEKALTGLLGEGFAIRPGFIATGNGRVYVVHRSIGDYYVEETAFAGFTRCVLGAVEAMMRGRISGKDVFRGCLARYRASVTRPRYKSFIGIKLMDRGHGRHYMRIAEEGYIYSASDLDLHASFGDRAWFAVEVLGGKRPRLDAITRFGGEGYPARIAVADEAILAEKLHDEKTYVAAVLLEPALLVPKSYEANPIDPQWLIDAVKDTATGFTKITGVYTLKNYVELRTPGYTLKENRLRKPRIMLPAGTIITGEGRPREIYMKGIGQHTNIGWGTAYPVTTE